MKITHKKFSLLLISLMFVSVNSFSQWTQAINISGQFVKSIVKCGNNYFAGTSTGILNIGQIYRSTDEGLNWSLVNTGFDISGVFSMAVKDNLIYVGTYEHGLLRSSDAGVTWTLNDLGIWKLGVFGVGVSGENNVFIYINHGTGMSLSTDKGLTFAPLSHNNQFSQFQTFSDLPGKFLAGSRKGVALSTNSGSNWSLQINTGLPQNPDGTKPVRAIYYFNDKLFAGCIDRMYISSDFGNNFTPTNFQLNNFEYFTSMASAGNKLFAGLTHTSGSSNPSVIMTTNDGGDWVNYQGDGFPGKGVYSICVSNDYLIAGTTQSGIWIRPLEKVTLTLTNSFEAFSLQDTITVELRNAVSPFNLIESKKGLGPQFTFTDASGGIPYFISVKHRNSITTWSNLPQTFKNNLLNYDFTTAESQAFGDNLVNVNGLWSIYTGDVNTDGVVDLSDIALIYNDVLNFNNGYVSTDLNYDGTVDLGDIVFGFNNSSKFVSERKP
ncbi:MAG: hypothetical protein IPL53_00870 [Ignavibacteria bacterium]|nr:hypothetical protein [Ignavibacteria bacterium]